jgi:hypothetical protein
MRLLRALLLILPLLVLAEDLTTPGYPVKWGIAVVGDAAALAKLTNAPLPVLLSGDTEWFAALLADGSLFAWGNNDVGQTNVPSGVFTNVAAGYKHGIAARADGSIVEWGTPYDDTLLDWTNRWPAAMKDNFSTDKVIEVAAGDDHSAALTASGKVYIWGGRELATNWNAVFTDAVKISASWYATLILRSNGTVTNVGATSHAGEYLNPPWALSNIVNIASGTYTAHAIDNTGKLWCWGTPNDYGELSVPAACSNVVSVSGGRRHTSAVRNDGTVFSFGSNASGQTNVPAGATNAAIVSAGLYNSIILKNTAGGGSSFPTNTYYVTKTGSDSNAGMTPDAPLLTIQRALNLAVTNGAVINVDAGDYPEYVTTVANNVTIRGDEDGETSLRGLWVNGEDNVTVERLTFWKGQGVGVSYTSSVRISGADSTVIKDCVFRDSPVLNRTNWTFSSVSNSIYSVSGSDWAAAGFEVGGKIRTGASTYPPYAFENSDRNFTISSIVGDAVYVVEAVDVETNASPWSIIYASPADHTGVRGIEIVVSSTTPCSNTRIIGNTFTNIYAIGISTADGGPTEISGNTFDTTAWASIRYGGDNLTVASNLFLDCQNFVYYTTGETNLHVGGSDYWDFVQGFVRTDSTPGTNITISRNWFENIHNPLGQLSGDISSGWTVTSNVFVGVAKQWDGMFRGSPTVLNNTFYRVSFDNSSSGHAILLNALATNIVVMRNAFIDVGDHGDTNSEGFYATATQVNSTYASNFVTSCELMGWRGMSTFTETNGINGGDPLLFNLQSPRGPDGIPFTDDDGLAPLPGSPLAIHGIGALPVKSAAAPIVRFSIPVTEPAVYGPDFNPAWDDVPAYSRTNYVRPWNTLDNTIGNVPATVFIDASDSISGNLSSTDNYGINLYVFDWGDGAIHESNTATNHHVYLWPGTFTVTVRARNTSGNWATNALQYRVLAQDTFAHDIFHVATNGNNTTGTGSYAAPWATIAKAVSSVTAGDYIAVHAGKFTGNNDLNNNVATTTDRISIHGFGAQADSFRIRYSNWTVHGFDIDSDAPTTSYGVYVFQTADNARVENCFIHDLGGSLFGGDYAVGSSTPSQAPTDQSTNGAIIGCTFTNIASPCIQIFGGLGWTVSNFRAINTAGEGDFIRPRGKGHTIQDGYVYNLNNRDSGGHPDFWQLDDQDGDGYWLKDLLFQRILVEGLAHRDIPGGAVTLTKATNTTLVTVSAPIFAAYMDDPETSMNIAVDGHPDFPDGWTWSITNYISSTQVEVSSAYGETNQTFTITDADAAMGQLESGAFADQTRYTNVIFRNMIFKNVRGTMSDSLDGLHFENCAFIQSGRVGNVTAGGGTRGSSWGTTFTNCIFVGVALTDATDTGWYFNDETVPTGTHTNTSVFADFNYVGGVTYVAKDSSWTYDGQNVHSINGGDPMFVNLALNDFRLATNSPLIGVGTDLSARFTTDFNGDPISVWNIGPLAGAAEAGAPQTPSPTPKANIRAGRMRAGRMR